jgi:hypothetical protein
VIQRAAISNLPSDRQPKPFHRKGREGRKGMKEFTAEIAEAQRKEGLLIFWMMNPFLRVLSGDFLISCYSR